VPWPIGSVCRSPLLSGHGLRLCCLHTDEPVKSRLGNEDARGTVRSEEGQLAVPGVWGFACGLDLLGRAPLPSDVLREDGGARWSKMTFLGTGFGDRFKVFRGGSRRFEEGLQLAEELAVLHGKRISTRRSLRCSRSTNPPW
jgi:hypothetical protein